MIAIGDPLKNLLEVFAQNNGGIQTPAYQNLLNALQASDTLMTEFNNIAGNQLKGFDLKNPPGSGASYDSNTKVIHLCASDLGTLTASSHL